MNVNMLKGKIIERGLTVPKLAEMVGIERSSLYRKLQSNDRMTIGAALRIKEALELTDEEACSIFLN